MATFQVDIGKATYEVDAPDEKIAWKMANDFHASGPKETPSTTEGRNLNSSVQGFINAMQAPTMGFADELYGGLSAGGRSIANAIGLGNGQSFGQNYQQARDLVRGATSQFREERPLTAALTSAAASAPLMLVGGGAPAVAVKQAIIPAASTLGRLATAGKVGAIQGGASGAGESTATDLEGVAADALKQAALGGSLGTAGQGVLGASGAVLGNVAQRVNKTSAADFARLKLAEALQRAEGGIPIRPGGAASPSKAADIQFLGPEATIADVSGQSGKRLLDVLATLPGKTKDLTEQLIRGRQAGRTERIMTSADEALGTGGAGYKTTIDALVQQKKTASAPLYQQIENLSVRVDPELNNLLQAAPKAHLGYEELSQLNRKSPIDLSKIKPGDDIPFDALDKVKQALWDLADKAKGEFGKPTNLSKSYEQLRIDLTNKMDKLSPKDATSNESIYKMARDAFAGPSQLEGAVKAGRGAMKTDAIGVGELTKGMGAGELEAFRIGALQSLRDKVGTESGQTSLLKMWKETGTSDKLKEIFGNDYKKFASAISKEAKLKELETVGRGSQTAERLFGEGDLGVLPAVGQAVAGAVQGNPLPAMGAIPKIWNQVKTPETTRDALAQLLLQRGTQAQETLRNLPNFMQNYNQTQARNAALANALAQQPTRNER
jgi:hypothetical protein